jgi:hypothetical protein
MTKLACIGLLATAFVAVGTSAHGQAFVSSNGNDANACTQAAPCATFAHAVSVISDGGSIQCLNSGQYANTTLTITKSVTIDCGVGNVGRMDLSGGGTIGININASSPASIILRHLNINGVNTATNINGVVTTNLPGGQLVIEDSTIGGFTGSGSNGYGILFTPNSGSPNGRATIFLENTEVAANNIGVSIAPASGQIASVFFANVVIGGNTGDGLDLAGAGTIAGDMRQSVVAASGGNGIVASSTNGVFFTIEGSTIVANLGIAIETNSSSAQLNVGASTIGANGTGVKSLLGSLISFGDNHMSANGSNGNFTSTAALQ